MQNVEDLVSPDLFRVATHQKIRFSKLLFDFYELRSSKEILKLMHSSSLSYPPKLQQTAYLAPQNGIFLLCFSLVLFSKTSRLLCTRCPIPCTTCPKKCSSLNKKKSGNISLRKSNCNPRETAYIYISRKQKRIVRWPGVPGHLTMRTWYLAI